MWPDDDTCASRVVAMLGMHMGVCVSPWCLPIGPDFVVRLGNDDGSFFLLARLVPSEYA